MPQRSQLRGDRGLPFYWHVDISGQNGLAVRITFSSAYEAFRSTETSLHFPLRQLPEDSWTLLILDLRQLLDQYLHVAYACVKPTAVAKCTPFLVSLIAELRPRLTKDLPWSSIINLFVRAEMSQAQQRWQRLALTRAWRLQMVTVAMLVGNQRETHVAALELNDAPVADATLAVLRSTHHDLEPLVRLGLQAVPQVVRLSAGGTRALCVYPPAQGRSTTLSLLRLSPDRKNTITPESHRWVADPLTVDASVNDVAFLPDDRDRFVTCGHNNIRFGRRRDNKIRTAHVNLYKHHHDTLNLTCIAIRHERSDACHAYVGSAAGQVFIVNTQTLRLARVLDLAPSSALCSLAIESTGAQLASVHANGLLHVWDAATGQAYLDCQLEAAGLQCVSTSTGLLVATANGQLGTLQLSNHAFLTLVRGHLGPVLDCRLVSDTNDACDNLITTGDDGTVRVWSYDGYRLRQTHHLALCQGSHQLESADAEDGTSAPSLAARLMCADAETNGDLIYAGFDDGVVRAINRDTAEVAFELDVHACPVARLQLGRDGVYLYTISADATLVQIALASRTVTRALDFAAPGAAVPPCFRLAPNGRFLAVLGPTASTVAVVEADSLDELCRVELELARPESGTAAPIFKGRGLVFLDDKQLAVACGHAVVLINVERARVERIFPGDDVHALALEPARGLLCLSSHDGVDIRALEDPGVSLQQINGIGAVRHVWWRGNTLYTAGDLLAVAHTFEPPPASDVNASDGNNALEAPATRALLPNHDQDMPSPGQSKQVVLQEAARPVLSGGPQANQPMPNMNCPTPPATEPSLPTSTELLATVSVRDASAHHIEPLKSSDDLAASLPKRSEPRPARPPLHPEHARYASHIVPRGGDPLLFDEDGDDMGLLADPLPPPAIHADAFSPRNLAEYEAGRRFPDAPEASSDTPMEDGVGRNSDIDRRSAGLRRAMHLAHGFNTNGHNLLWWHPETGVLVYASGNLLVVERLEDSYQAVLKGHHESITALSVSRDGTLAATASTRAESDDFCEIRVWSLVEGSPLHTMHHHAGEVNCLELSPDGRWLLSVGNFRDLSVALWGVGDGALLCTAHVDVPVHDAAWHPSVYNQFALCGDACSLFLGRVTDHHAAFQMGLARAPVPQLTTRDQRPVNKLMLTCLAFTGDGLVLVCDDDGWLHVWDEIDRRHLVRWLVADEGDYALRLVYRQQGVMTCSQSGVCRLWQLDAPSATLELQRQQEAGAPVLAAVADLSLDLVVLATAQGHVLTLHWPEDTCLELWRGHGSDVQHVCLSARAQHLATVTAMGTFHLWHLADMEQVLEIRLQEPCAALCCDIARDEKRAIAGYLDGHVRVFDLQRGDLDLKLRVGRSAVTSVRFSYDERVIIVAQRSGRLNVLSATTGQVLRSLKDHGQAPLTGLDIAQASSSLPAAAELWLATSHDRRISVWCADWSRGFNELYDWLSVADASAAPTPPPTSAMALTSDPGMVARFHPVNSDLVVHACGRAEPRLFVYSLSQRSNVTVVSLPRIPISLAVHPSLPRVLVGSADRLVTVLDTDQSTFQDYCAHDGPVLAVDFLLRAGRRWSQVAPAVQRLMKPSGQEGRGVAQGSGAVVLDGLSDTGRGCGDCIRVPDTMSVVYNDTTLQSFQIARVFDENRNRINALDFSADGELLATSSNDDHIHIYSCLKADVTSLSINPADDTFISTSQDKTMRLWDMRSPNCQGLMLLNSPDTLATFDATSKVFAVAVDSRSIHLYDARKFHQGPFVVFQETLRDMSSSWTDISASPDGSRLLVSTLQGVNYVVDAYSGDVRSQLGKKQGSTGGSGEPMEASWSPDGRYAAVGSKEGKVIMWDAENSNRVAMLAGHHNPVSSVKFNPKYALLASACSTLALWLPKIEE
ncbi:uncharacterized protein MONBRDRAFT_8091 [Monosiga brevicollis MX1]|uniref:WDR90 4th beta-propeller domain-containing protein n=1 Tax=Monosiga brevicollis TaxID=81824 RepID=A9UZ10_MONBE|nr:uncharacterized protein MONBRDRAFT_8091 [Monosiga brevicollis MX1]EDQ89552.1 predicted protein [Monosiga brevicollis MX1]|eukprot:XP_001745581.1 hypothetical protein [Monosiga brevicollis MX1]